MYGHMGVSIVFRRSSWCDKSLKAAEAGGAGGGARLRCWSSSTTAIPALLASSKYILKLSLCSRCVNATNTKINRKKKNMSQYLCLKYTNIHPLSSWSNHLLEIERYSTKVLFVVISPSKAVRI